MEREELQEMNFLYNPPLLARKIFPNVIWDSTGGVVFTFDDGPIPETTPKILKKLSEHSIKAIFFCVGENVSKYPELAKEIINQGHLIGNHTQNHNSLLMKSGKFIENQILECNSECNKLGLDVPDYFRPPKGRLNFRTNSILKKNNMKTVMWNLLTYDYKNDLNIVKFAVTKYLHLNSIVVLHDSLKSSGIILDSIDFIVEEINKKKFVIGDPSECLK